MKSVNVIDDIIEFSYPYSEVFVSEVKKFSDRKWDKERKKWLVRPMVQEKDALYGFVSKFYGVSFINVIDGYFDSVEKRISDSQAASCDKYSDYVSKSGKKLYPFQRAGVDFLISHEKAIIGDEMGLGKTIQAIAATDVRDGYPALVICPKIVKINWRREWVEWAKRDRVVILNGKIKDAIPEADVYIVNYDILDDWIDIIEKIKLKTVIVDEFHYIKNPKAVRTKAVSRLVKNPDISYVMFLSGTPILNRPIEIWTSIDMLGFGDKFGGFWKFAFRYCDAQQTEYGWDLNGANNLKDLNDRMRALCYLRREKEQVLNEIPDKQRTKFHVQLSPKDEKEYYICERDLLTLLKKNSELKSKIKDKLGMDDNDVSDLVDNLKRTSSEILVKIEKIKQLCMKMKFDLLCELVDELLEENPPIVIFAVHREMIEYLEKKYNCSSITGSTSLNDRQRIIDDFQNGKSKILVCNIKAGGMGITLTKSSNCIFAELGWTPAEHEQAEDRLHRIGQKNSVNAYYVVLQNTIEDDIYDVVFGVKKVIVDMVNIGEVKDVQEKIFDVLYSCLLQRHEKVEVK